MLTQAVTVVPIKLRGGEVGEVGEGGEGLLPNENLYLASRARAGDVDSRSVLVENAIAFDKRVCISACIRRERAVTTETYANG